MVQLMHLSHMKADVILANPYVLFAGFNRNYSAPMQRYTATGHDVRAILGRGHVLLYVSMQISQSVAS